ncbi:MAG: class I SAM-dependent methyltransferase [archaeon]
MKNRINSIKRLMKGIDGWLSDEEGEFLFNKAKECSGRGAIVEIGSWKGKSTIWLGLGSKEGSKTRVYAVDPHNAGADEVIYGRVNTLKEFKDNIKRAKLDEVVKPIVKDSTKASKDWKKPIELLFIDGSHQFDLVKKDFLNWSRFLVEGGLIAFHDSLLWPGPRKVVNKMLLASNYFKEPDLIDSITCARKTSSVSFNDRINNNKFWIEKNLRELNLRYGYLKLSLRKKAFLKS